MSYGNIGPKPSPDFPDVNPGWRLSGTSLGFANSQAQGINDYGVIVGDTYASSGPGSVAFVDIGDVMTNLNSLVNLNGVTLVDATAINDAGQIVADGDNGQAYLLTAIPEPSTYAAILGAAALGLAASHRRQFSA